MCGTHVVAFVIIHQIYFEFTIDLNMSRNATKTGMCAHIPWPVNQSELRNCNVPWLGFNNRWYSPSDSPVFELCDLLSHV